MAYNYFPKSESELKTKLKSYPKQVLTEVVSVFNYLKKINPKIDPINIDTGSQRNINVNRALKSTDLAKVSKSLKLSQIKLKFGNGSAGNRGVNNQGAGFERQFLVDIQNWFKGDVDGIDKKSMAAIENLDNTYNISASKFLRVVPEGGSNTKRPLVFGDNGITLMNSKGKGLDVGKSISDVTLVFDSNAAVDKVYLSLKASSTVTFFNVGLKTILTKEEIQSGKIKNSNGKKLLKLFGINEKLFCDVFNGNPIPANKAVDTKSSANAAEIQKLLESGIGYGYHILHQFPKYVESKKMDQRAMKAAATIVTPITVYYGGMKGAGKRIDITFDSADYSFKLNIRDTQGTDGYPTRLMCDFRHK